MATKYIATATAQQDITESGYTWILPWYGRITSSTHGISEASTYSGNRIEVDGAIECTGGGSKGVRSLAVDGDVAIGETGYVSAVMGVSMETHTGAVSVFNAGLIVATNIGVGVLSDARIENTGSIISGDNGIVVASSPTSAEIVNSGVIRAVVGISTDAAAAAVELSATGRIISENCIVVMNGAATVDNAGLLRGNSKAFDGGTGDDVFINEGKVAGNVFLDAGNDEFRSDGGVMRGTVYGRQGDDDFYVDNAEILINEAAGEGTDRVFSTVSYALTTGDIEVFTLKGKSDINATGAGTGEAITGNSGKNSVSGLAGADRLDGGKGSDRLDGGDGTDTFVFSTGWGKDRILDYADGQDRIDLSGLDAVKNFNDLKNNHMTEKSGGVVIKAGDDQLTIDGAVIADFQDTDFLF